MSKIGRIIETDSNNPKILAVKEAMKKTKEKRMHQRYLVILHYLKGYNNTEISEKVALCQQTVGIYVNKYKCGFSIMKLARYTVLRRKDTTLKFFFGFLKSVLNKYITERIVMILDNARIHHAKLLKPFLKEHKNRLQLEFFPPYSPKFNLLEGFWGWLKSEVVNNVFYSSERQIREADQGFTDSVNKVPLQVIDRLCLRL